MLDTMHAGNRAIGAWIIDRGLRWCAALLVCLAVLTLLAISTGSVSASGSDQGGTKPVPVLTAKGTPAAPMAAAQVPDCSPDWTLVASEAQRDQNSYINGVAIVSPNDIWAVGDYIIHASGNSTPRWTLTMHWDGSQWNRVGSPNVNPFYNSELFAVTAISNSDVWAVGFEYDPNTNSDRTLTEHWNGTTWNIITSPNVGAGNNYLYGVSATANSVWAAGYSTSAGVTHTLIMKWDGLAWNTVNSPNQAVGNSSLTGVSVVPGSNGADIWAVGFSFNGGAGQTLIERYTGGTWSIVASPNAGSNFSRLQSVSAIAPGDVWAVGASYDGANYHPLSEHWNGSSWSIIPTLVPANAAGGSLTSVSGLASGDVWAVGGYDIPGASGALILHWNGSAWSIVPGGAPVGTFPTLNAVATGSGGNAWVGGVYSPLPTSPYATLLEHYTGAEWRQIWSPNGPSNNNILYGVSASSSINVWAVGYWSTSDIPDVAKTLIERWNGTSWSIVSSPNAGPTSNVLSGVAAVPGNINDAWTVGSYTDPASNKDRTFIERWNGTTWNVIASPNASSDTNRLAAVSVVSANDVWAVGYYASGGVFRTLTEHWNGSTWIVIASPNPNAYSATLDGVSVVPGTSGADVWAVGSYSTASGAELTLAERWNAATASWSIVASPNTAALYNSVSGVSALSSGDVWIVGSTSDPGQAGSTLVEHWNGSAWSIVPSPNQGSIASELAAVVALAPGDVWAAGTYQPAPGTSATLIEHWNGSSWSVVPSPGSGSGVRNALNAIAAVSPSEVWSVGQYGPEQSPRYQALIERYKPCPAACAIQFNDVPNGSTFYSYTRCLACQGILGGYACGGVGEPCPGSYFRPNDNVTRGQAAKIIANSAGYTDNIQPGTQTFVDVPPNSAFYLFVERVYLHGAISGYACGGAGEPCPGLYFRPGANLTRGQLAKITTSVAGYNEPVSGQSFNDVPNGSPFWVYIERAHTHNIIGGYACGGAGEPCPGAYFRPGVNVTRGQTAKIVSGTFFPDCGYTSDP